MGRLKVELLGQDKKPIHNNIATSKFVDDLEKQLLLRVAKSLQALRQKWWLWGDGIDKIL